jgi:hypothetical protein
MFAGEEGFEFEFAMKTGDRSQRDDRNEENCLFDRRFDLRFPQLSRSDRCLILPQRTPPGFTELSTQLALNAVSERRQHPARGFVILARIAENPTVSERSANEDMRNAVLRSDQAFWSSLPQDSAKGCVCAWPRGEGDKTGDMIRSAMCVRVRPRGRDIAGLRGGHACHSRG